MTIFWICFVLYWVVSWVTLPGRFHRMLASLNKKWTLLDNTDDARLFALLTGAVWPIFYPYWFAMLLAKKMTNPTEHLTRKQRAEIERQREIDETEQRKRAVRQQIRDDETRRMIEWDDQFRQLLGNRSVNYRIENDPETYFIEARRRALMDAERQIVEERNSNRKTNK